jgi:hypothetical protein
VSLELLGERACPPQQLDDLLDALTPTSKAQLLDRFEQFVD